MSDDLTLDEKARYAAQHAVEHEAEKHFFDLEAPKHFPRGFSIEWRNPHHWDVYADRVPGRASAWRMAHPEGTTSESDNERERAFRIRGEPGNVIVMDERWNPHRPHPRESMKFRSVIMAVMWIAEELMREPAP